MFLWNFLVNPPAPPEIYTLSLHDALPILGRARPVLLRHQQDAVRRRQRPPPDARVRDLHVTPVQPDRRRPRRSEEHTSELQSRFDLVCRLLLEKKKKIYHTDYTQLMKSTV